MTPPDQNGEVIEWIEVSFKGSRALIPDSSKAEELIREVALGNQDPKSGKKLGEGSDLKPHYATVYSFGGLAVRIINSTETLWESIGQNGTGWQRANLMLENALKHRASTGKPFVPREEAEFVIRTPQYFGMLTYGTQDYYFMSDESNHAADAWLGSIRIDGNVYGNAALLDSYGQDHDVHLDPRSSNYLFREGTGGEKDSLVIIDAQAG